MKPSALIALLGIAAALLAVTACSRPKTAEPEPAHAQAQPPAQPITVTPVSPPPKPQVELGDAPRMPEEQTDHTHTSATE